VYDGQLSAVGQFAHWVPVARSSSSSNTVSNSCSSRPAAAATDSIVAESSTRRARPETCWVQGYLDAGHDRRPLITTLALGAAKQGNDPHNQEIGLCMLEDYGRTSSPHRDRLLLACAKHTAGHRKYGDTLESYGRFAEAFGLPPAVGAPGEREPIEMVLDEIETIPEADVEERPSTLLT
jgi:hypothetical protein